MLNFKLSHVKWHFFIFLPYAVYTQNTISLSSRHDTLCSSSLRMAPAVLAGSEQVGRFHPRNVQAMLPAQLDIPLVAVLDLHPPP